ncbi:hypothetical protein SprV_1002891400 [Sparganum proliferum]
MQFGIATSFTSALKLEMHKAVILSTLMHGTETWTLNMKQINPSNWEDVDRDRPTWKRAVKTGATIFGANHITVAAKSKRGTRKSRLPPSSPPAPPPPYNANAQSSPTCAKCQRAFWTPIGLFGHIRSDCGTQSAPTLVSPSISPAPPTTSTNLDRPTEPPLPSSSFSSSSSSSSSPPSSSPSSSSSTSSTTAAAADVVRDSTTHISDKTTDITPTKSEYEFEDPDFTCNMPTMSTGILDANWTFWTPQVRLPHTDSTNTRLSFHEQWQCPLPDVAALIVAKTFRQKRPY